MNTAVQKTDQNSAPTARRQEYVRPYYEVTGAEDHYDVRVYLPGVPRDQASITLEGDSLVIEAHRGQHWQEGWRPVHREIPPADFRLRLQLNVAINEEGITASSQDGVLSVHLPVAEEAKPRTIRIE